MSESVPPTSSQILYQNISNQVAGNTQLTLDTGYQGTRLDAANVLVTNKSILSGNVGIHTATPRGSLEVTGNTILTAQGSDLIGTHQFGLNGSYDSLSIVSPVGVGMNGTTSIFFGLNSLIYYPVARIVAVDNGNYSGSLAFQIGNGEQLYQQMRLTMNGITSGNAAFLYKTFEVPSGRTNFNLTFPGTNGTTSIIEVYVILQRKTDSSFANMVKFTVFLGINLYVTNITVQGIGNSSIIIARNGVSSTGSNVAISYTDILNDYMISINYMIYGPATAFLTEITYLLNASLSNTIPGVPSGITAIPGNQSVFLNWNAPPNGGTDIRGYTISDSSGNSVNPIASIDASGNFSSSLTPDAPKTLLITNANVVTNTAVNITGLVNGTSYTFSIKAKNDIGYSGTNTVTVIPSTVPTVPQITGVTPGNRSVSVTWIAPTNDGGSPVSLYTITSNPGSFTATSSSVTPTSVSGLSPGTSYTFTVVARNAAGNSAPSPSSSSVTTFSVPGQPTGVTATGGANSATVSWSAPSSTGGSSITLYTIISNPGSFTATSSTVTPTTVLGLTAGTSYTFTVIATSAVGDSLASSPSSSVTAVSPPDPPTNVSAVAGSTSATITWTAPANNKGSSIISYTIVSTTGGVSTETLKTENIAVSSVNTTTITNLTPGETYTFSVYVSTQIGRSDLSAPSGFIRMPGPPGFPRDVLATGGANSVTVTWNAPSSDGGSPVTSYVITSNPGSYTAISYTVAPTTVIGLSAGTSYTFTVVARNAAGDSLPSPPSAPVNTFSVPAPPTDVSAVAGATSVTVSWTAPLFNGGSPITSYTITSNPGSITKDSSTVTPTEVLGLTRGTSYTFTVVATNAIGSSSPSSASSAVTILSAAGAPDPPQSMEVRPSEDLIAITIQPPSNLNAGGRSIIGYRIYCYETTLMYDPNSGYFKLFSEISDPLRCSTTTTFCVLYLNSSTSLFLDIVYEGKIQVVTVNSEGIESSKIDNLMLYRARFRPLDTGVYLLSSESLRFEGMPRYSDVWPKWYGRELFFYYPEGNTSVGTHGPEVVIIMPDDFLINSAYWGLKIFTAIIGPAGWGTKFFFKIEGAFLKIEIGGNQTNYLRWTGWAVPPARTNLGSSPNPFGIIVDSIVMGDNNLLRPTRY